MTTRTFTFKPGPLERVTLSLWRKRNDPTVVESRISGLVTVRCPTMKHVETLDYHYTWKAIPQAWREKNDGATVAQKAYKGNQFAAELTAAMMTWRHVSDTWVDPCTLSDDSGSGSE